jgi:hypothetical protein
VTTGDSSVRRGRVRQLDNAYCASCRIQQARALGRAQGVAGCIVVLEALPLVLFAGAGDSSGRVRLR